MELAPFKRYFTEEEYLLIERQAEYKSEFYKGEIFAMSGAKLAHNIINGNLNGEFYSFLKGKKCRGFSQDMRVHIPANSLYTYPDFFVVCDKPKFVPDHKMDTLINPIIIIEILSESTHLYDHGKKFELYKDIESLKQYVLIDSIKKYSIISYNRKGEIWESMFYKNQEEMVLFPTIEFRLSSQIIYDGVD